MPGGSAQMSDTAECGKFMPEPGKFQRVSVIKTFTQNQTEPINIIYTNMKPLSRGLLAGTAALLLASCAETNPWQEGEGPLKLRLRTSAEVAVSSPTRAEQTLEVPDLSAFKVKLTKSDNTYSKTWESLDGFNAEESFRTGSYTIEAFCGDIDEEGFEAPYFHGAAQVNVLEDKNNEASVTASLANSMVSVIYTEAFKNYFSDWSARVHSAGHSYIDFARDETRPAYIYPDEVDLSVTVTNPQGKTASLQPAGFRAQPRHHYRVTFDVANNTGTAHLIISFDDTLVSEDVEIDLSDELFSTQAPKVTPEGFTDGQVLETLQGNAENRYKFNVVAHGGIEEANLTVESDYRPPFGNEVNLAGASQSLQDQVSGAGLRVKGVFKKENWGFVDLTDFLSTLPEGTHKITLVVKDKYTRVSEPVSLVVTTEPLTLEASAEPVSFGSNAAVINVAYNGTDASSAFSFKAMDQYGVYKDCKITKVEEKQATRSFPVKHYAFHITLPYSERETIGCRLFYRGQQRSDLTLPVTFPTYTVEADAFATRVAIRPVASTEALRNAIARNMKVSVVGSAGSSFTISRDAAHGLVYVSGFAAGNSYTVNTYLTDSQASSPITSTQVSTEAAAQLPNNNFTETQQSVSFSKLQVGGTFLVGAITYSVYSSIDVKTPTGWATLNDKTAWSGASNLNTWFVVPSTIADAGKVTVRSVAYDHNGTTPERTGSFFSTTYYNPTAATCSQKSAGELFLGTYSFNGSESRTNGIAFASRPSSMSFRYTYAPLHGENGQAVITLLDASGSTIATASADIAAASSSSSMTVPLPAYTFGRKASTIVVRFLSTKGTPTIDMPSGSALNEGGGLNINYTVDANAYKTYGRGSVLTLENVTLNY